MKKVKRLYRQKRHSIQISAERDAHRTLSRVELFIQESGKEASVMDLVSSNGQMVQGMKENGVKIELMAKANSCTLTEMSMMDSGPMIKLTVSVYICMLTVQSMRACGAMIFNMARVLRHGQMDLNMRVNMHSDASMALDSISGTTAPNTLASGKKIRFLASASTPG